ncbi:MAG: hypothetical protein QNJ45_18945 [Ardenticatenaceae bacterium]|nr:hypothetical protein [Ardenticatenaceae bacterium]
MADDTRATFAIQILTALLSILMAAAVIFLFWYIGDQMDWRTGDPYNFWVFDLMMGGVLAFFATFSTIRHQFVSALDPREISKDVFQFFVLFWILIVFIFHGGSQFFTSQDIWFSFQVITYSTGVLFSLALAIGFAQVFLLYVTGFDKQLHLYRISNAVALQACKRGKLPYREKIRLLGKASLGMVLFLLMVVIIILFPENEACLNTMMGGMALLLLTAIVQAINMLQTPRLFTFSGPVTKSIDTVLGYRGLLHLIHCQDRSFDTSIAVWVSIEEYRHYELWFIPAKTLGWYNWVIAFAEIEEPSSTD